ncbi:hypothetical protein C0991_005640 [Blastosporella zonata]|nr:hypothetical protein C0991_005640 [Blastosporella zonata]
MATYVLTKAGKKLFAKHIEQYAPEDAMYEFYTDEKGKQKRKKRPLPPGLSPRDKKILTSVRKRAHYLDKGFNLCGLHFGWTFFIGLIPVVGDVTNASLNYNLVIRKARKADIPSWLLKRMLFNVAVSTGVGFVPVVGDVAVAVYKPNNRNAALLEEMLRLRGLEYIRLHPDGGDGAGDAPVAGGPGLSENDIEQVKPGAGFGEEEEVQGSSSGGLR